MSINYQSLTGLFELSADQLNVDTLTVQTLVIPNGAADGLILTSDNEGIASWQPDPNVLLAGDITGPLLDNYQANKYTNIWNSATAYLKANQVSKDDQLFIANTANVNMDPTVLSTPTFGFYNVSVPTATSSGSLELGVSFQASTDGVISAIRFYKYPDMSGGTRIVKLWSTSGVGIQLSSGSVSIAAEPISGWVTIPITPYHITKNVTYMASYNHDTGTMPLNPDHSAANQTKGLTLFGFGSSYNITLNTQPSSSVLTDYFVDVDFTSDVPVNDWDLMIRGITVVEKAKIDNATSLNTFATLVERDTNGDFAASNITAHLIGNADTCTLATNVITNANLTGMVTSVGNAATVVTNANLTGDVTSIGNASTVVTVGGSTAALIHSAELKANAASPSNIPNTIALRDASGNFVVNAIYGDLIGNATNFTGSLAGEVSGGQSSTVVSNSAVISKLLTGYLSGAGTISGSDSILSAVNKLTGNLGLPTNANIANQIVKRDASGNFAAGMITASLYGTATNFGGALSGEVSGGQSSTVVSNSAVISKVLTGYSSGAGTITSADTILSAINKLNGNIVSATGTQYATPNTLVLRDGSANFDANGIYGAYISSSGTVNGYSLTGNNISSSSYINAGSYIQASQSIVAGTNVVSSSFVTPSVQGAYMAWNRGVGLSGATCFMNQEGGGSGAWEWINYNSSNTLTSPNPCMTLTKAGNLSTPNFMVSGHSTYIHYEIAGYVTFFDSSWKPVTFSGYAYSSDITTVSLSSFTSPYSCNYFVSWNIPHIISAGGTSWKVVVTARSGSTVTSQTTPQYTYPTSSPGVGACIAVGHGILRNVGAGDIIEFNGTAAVPTYTSSTVNLGYLPSPIGGTYGSVTFHRIV
jgi:hypothetical protein